MRQPRIVIIDYDVGNTRSVSNAIRTLGYRRLKISRDEADILQADALILPGVGAFGACASNLRKHRLDLILNDAVLTRKKPILGICVGMQLMATVSEENGDHPGLDWISGRVAKLVLPDGYSVPHVGWNEVRAQCESRLFSSGTEERHFYFDHSYHYQCESEFVSAECDYGIRVASAIEKDNILAVQFHPEKSQQNGLKLFRRFLNGIS